MFPSIVPGTSTQLFINKLHATKGNAEDLKLTKNCPKNFYKMKLLKPMNIQISKTKRKTNKIIAKQNFKRRMFFNVSSLFQDRDY